MNIIKLFKKIFCKDKSNKDHSKINFNDSMKKSNKVKDDKSFHPEILFLINRADAEYIDFVEVNS